MIQQSTDNHEAMSESLQLTYGQQALWFLQQSAPETVAYNVGVALRIHARLDVAALRRALETLVARQPSLRTTFPLQDGLPVQVIHASTPLAWTVVDAQHWTADVLRQRVIAVHETPFDLQRGPLLRTHLFVCGPADHLLVMGLHHIISDGWSNQILVEAVCALYSQACLGNHDQIDAASPLLAHDATPMNTYADYVHAQADLLASAEGEKLRRYWHEQLAGELPLLNLPTDRPLPPVQRYHGASQYFELPPEQYQPIASLAKTEGATLFATLLAAFQLLLHRYSGQTEIVVGAFADGRWDRDYAATIGYFVNPVAIRTMINGEQSFRALLAQVRQTALMALSYQDYPFPLLVEQLQRKRTLSHPPIFQVALNWVGHQLQHLAAFHLPNDGTTQLVFGDLTVEPYPLPHQEGAFFLTLELCQSAERLRGYLKYNTDLFDAATIGRMVGHFQQLLAAIAANPDQPIAHLPLLTPAERQQQLATWNQTATPYPHRQCIHRLFEAQVKRTPERVAVVCGWQNASGKSQPATRNSHLTTLTYRELNMRANQLAHHLRTLGVGPDVLVGICVERSLEMLVGLLGILKAGGAYVPLDPAFPPERLAFMIEDAQPLVLLTQQKLLQALPIAKPNSPTSNAQPATPTVLCLDSDWPAFAQARTTNPNSGVTTEKLAYVIYTSGSTGRPKGVQIEHRALTNFLHSMRHRPGLCADDVLLAVTTISFDIAGLELYLPLISGAQVVLADRSVAADGLQLVQLLNTCGATVMQATPATWRMMLAAGWQGSPGLKMLCGGEALPQGLADQLLAKGASLWNMYGPTETTIWSAIYQVTADRPQTDAAMPIGGGPLGVVANTELYILDAHRQPVPIGVTGELYIGGDGLARGYLNQPELTAARFLTLDFGSNGGDHQTQKLYRTGDLARYLPSGEIEYLGRIDNQVKVHGFRIELGEIEAVLSQHPAVAESVVVVRTDQAGDQQLVAYVVRDDKAVGLSDNITLPSPHPITSSDLRHYLQQKLPAYMTPAVFVFIEALPLTPNGKVDRNALPAPVHKLAVVTEDAPQSATEVTLTTLWRELLGIDSVGRMDDFFAVGGHSLRATQLIYRIQETFGVTLSVQQLFHTPTIAGLAQAITHLSSAQPQPPTGNRSPTTGRRSCVVALQTAPSPRQSYQPFFCVHPVAGVVFPYTPLVAALGPDQPFYGLQAVGITEGATPLTQIEAMASRYLDDLRLIQPAGPYAIGGWSFGAYVAYEMARQLEQAGQTVALLAIMDTPPPSPNKLIDAVNWSNFLLTAALPALWPYIQEYVQLRNGKVSLHRNGGSASQTDKEEAARKSTMRFRGYGIADLLRLVQITRINVQAAIDYAPPPYGGRITLFRTGQTFGSTDQTPDLGWRALAAGGVELYRIPGQHMNLLRAPHVQVLAGQLQRQLEAATAQPTRS